MGTECEVSHEHRYTNMCLCVCMCVEAQLKVAVNINRPTEAAFGRRLMQREGSGELAVREVARTGAEVGRQNATVVCRLKS